MPASQLEWMNASGPETLPDGEVHVWRISSGTRERAIDEMSRRFLRLLLGRYTGTGSEQIRFLSGRYGKLSLDGGPDAHEIQFNLSHSGSTALVAVARGKRVGVDVERVRTTARIDDIMAEFFSTEESAWIREIGGPARIQAFHSCWTRKEAVVKALGGSIMLLADKVIVSGPQDREARLLRMPSELGGPGEWRLLDLPVPAGYAAALCHQAPAAPVRLWAPPDWNP